MILLGYRKGRHKQNKIAAIVQFTHIVVFGSEQRQRSKTEIKIKIAISFLKKEEERKQTLELWKIAFSYTETNTLIAHYAKWNVKKHTYNPGNHWMSHICFAVWKAWLLYQILTPRQHTEQPYSDNVAIYWSILHYEPDGLLCKDILHSGWSISHRQMTANINRKLHLIL